MLFLLSPALWRPLLPPHSLLLPLLLRVSGRVSRGWLKWKSVMCRA